jgi:hypothetical protein
VALCAAFVSVACLADSALALNGSFYAELSPADRHAITDFIYERSPQGTVPYPGGAAEISESISHTYESEAPAQPVYTELAGWGNTLEEDVGEIPELDEEMPEFTVADGTFYVGWKIGEGVDAIFAKVGLGPWAAPEENFLGAEGYEFCYSAGCGASLKWYPYGYDLYSGATIQQEPGAYLYGAILRHYGGVGRPVAPVEWDQSPCEFSDFSPPPYSRLETVDSGVGCWNGGSRHEDYLDYPYVSLGQLLSKEEFHRYDALLDPEPTLISSAPEDPGTAFVEEKTAEALDGSGIGQAFVTQAEADADGDSEPNYEYLPAPMATEKKVDDEERRCDRGTATFTNLGGNESPEPFAPFEPTPFTITSLPPGVESPSPVYLRWGEAEWQGEQRDEQQNMDVWGGWGYRHIAAKHGWDVLDREETEAALARPQTPDPAGGLKWEYRAPVESAGSTKCVRVVFVQFENGENRAGKDPAPRGIATSYNEVVE